MDRGEAVKVFRQRLLDAGAEFSGPLPTKAEVEAARKETERRKSLEGIDTSNIVRGQKRRSVGRDTEEDPPAKAVRGEGCARGRGCGPPCSSAPSSPCPHARRRASRRSPTARRHLAIEE